MVKKILYFMLLLGVGAVVAELLGADPVIIFILAALGIVPLADFIGEATEELTVYTGPTLGGLLNATLGNSAELIITIFAIRAGLLELVLASITGSIIGNLLLVMGLSLLFGGLKNGVQTFDKRKASLNSTMIVLAVVALMIPSLFSQAMDDSTHIAMFNFNQSVAVVLILFYGLSIFYSLKGENSVLKRESAAHTVHESRWSMRKSLIVLTLATVGVILMSEILIGSIEHVTASLGLSELFIGIILIPLIGNVAEHLVAVEVAHKNNMELSMAISLGSSLQIALFVAPLLVFISLLFGEHLLLVFSTFELIALFSASLVAALITLDGETNWLEGAQLLTVYLIIALAFFFLPG